jgi:hypothetical protein
MSTEEQEAIDLARVHQNAGWISAPLIDIIVAIDAQTKVAASLLPNSSGR